MISLTSSCSPIAIRNSRKLIGFNCIEYNNKVVQFDFNPSDSSQEVQSNQSGVKLDSLNVFDFCGKILDQAEENFANSIGTSDEEQCKEELCRKLREKKRGDYGYEFSC